MTTRSTPHAKSVIALSLPRTSASSFLRRFLGADPELRSFPSFRRGAHSIGRSAGFPVICQPTSSQTSHITGKD